MKPDKINRAKYLYEVVGARNKFIAADIEVFPQQIVTWAKNHGWKRPLHVVLASTQEREERREKRRKSQPATTPMHIEKEKYKATDNWKASWRFDKDQKWEEYWNNKPFNPIHIVEYKARVARIGG